MRYLFSLCLLLIVTSFVRSDDKIDITLLRMKRGIILDTVGRILHPKKDEQGSDILNAKKFDIKTPIGSISLSATHQYHQEPSSVDRNRYPYNQQYAPNVGTWSSSSYPNDNNHNHIQPVGNLQNPLFSSPPQQQHNFNIPHLHIGVGSISTSSYPNAESAFGPYPFQYGNVPAHHHYHQQQQYNKEEDEMDIVFPQHHNLNINPDGGKLNEGGTVNVIKKDTDPYNNKGQQQSAGDEPTPNSEESGSGKIQIRVGTPIR